MITTILGKTIRWYQSDDWIFDPFQIRGNRVEYTLAQGPHTGRHATQVFDYQRVAPGVETTAWYEETGTIVHITWYLETQTTHRFAALPAWLGQDISVSIGDNSDPAFVAKMRELDASLPDAPRRILSDQGYFQVLSSATE
jgi:phenolic acid decarboxylase